MIATNKYLELWKKSAQSLLLAQNENSNITIHLFTDQPENARSWWKSLDTKNELRTYLIPPFKWPEATLLRYKIINDHIALIEEDLLIYMDSDMIVEKEFISSLRPSEWLQGIALVRHPGFYRPNFRNGLRTRRANPSILIQDLKFLLKLYRGMGSWEIRKTSTSFVPRLKRHEYVHGAIWMGKNEELRSMISLLSKHVDQDLQRGLVAVWHDESHLNWYFSNHNVSLLDCNYSWYAAYSHLKHISPYVYSMDKDEMNFQRLETSSENK